MGAKVATRLASATSDDNSKNKALSFVDNTKSFLMDVRTEMRKVTTPSGKEVRATTGVVIITVFIFGVFFYIVDRVLGLGIESLLHWAQKL